MPTIHIRPAVPADLDTLCRFEQGVIETERPYDPTIRPGAIHYYNLPAMMESPDVHLVIADVNGVPAGSGYARLEPARHYLNHAVYAYLGFMYVEPAFRGQGVNAAIIEVLRDWAHSRQIIELRLDVYVDNERAIKAYEKAGFIPHLLNMRRPV